MDTALDFSSASGALDINKIRFQLIRLEDTIIFNMIERVQFPLNKDLYVPGGITIPGCDLSFMEWLLREQEHLQSLVRRYESPDECPFFPEALQAPILKPIRYPIVLHLNTVNVNSKLKSCYLDEMLPRLCKEHREASENYGSTAVADVLCLQSLSRRIHFGKVVAEAKFRRDPEKITRLVKSGDVQGIMDVVTDKMVEFMVVERLRMKARWYGSDPMDINQFDGSMKFDTEEVSAIYKDYIIPLTKEVEVAYLMQRVKGTEGDKEHTNGDSQTGLVHE